MSPQPTPLRHHLRQMLRAVLATDSDFGAFCVDFFPTVAERFANSMDRVAKATLLLELEDPADVVAALRQHDPQRLAQYERRQPSPGSETRNPYRGLSAFQLNEAYLFFGREELTSNLWQRFETLCEKPEATRLLAIIGPSGSGKSSVARAGLLASLLQSPIPGPMPMRIAILRPGERPIESLARSLVALLPVDSGFMPAKRAMAIEDLLRNTKALGEGLRRFAVSELAELEQHPLVVLVDQCEELYTLCKNAADRDLFVELLLQAAQARSAQVSVVLTLRSDFLGETQRHHSSLNRLIADQGMMVPGLSPDELRDAITKPARQAGRPIDQATVELLLAESRGDQGALPLLEFALTRVWEGMERGKEPSATLREIGGVGGALAGKAKQIFGALSAPEQETAKRAFVRLVQLGEGTRDMRRRSPIRELCGHGQTEADVLAVLRQFSMENVRLVTLSETGAEVTHEALFEHWAELRKWIDESRDDRRLHDRAAEAALLWENDLRHSGRLWRRPDLDLLRDYQKRKPEELSPLQDAFLRSSEKQQQRDRQLRWGSVLSVFVALIAAAGIYITKERQYAHQAMRHVQAERGARAKLLAQQMPGDLEALRLGLESVGPSLRAGESPPREAIDGLIASSQAEAYPRFPAWIHNGEVTDVNISSDGSKIVTACSDGVARLWDANTGATIAIFKGHAGQVNAARFSPDGLKILTASSDGTARIWDIRTGEPISMTGHTSSVIAAAFSPDGAYVVTASNDGTVRRWQASTGAIQAVLPVDTGSGFPMQLSFAQDGSKVLIAGPNKRTTLWGLKTNTAISMNGQTSSVRVASLSPDGSHVVTGSIDGVARLFNASTGTLQTSNPQLRGRPLSVTQFSPDGREILMASYNGEVKLWNMTKPEEMLATNLKGHTGAVFDANFSTNGAYVVTASDDRTARLWDAHLGNLIAVFRGHTRPVSEVRLSNDGRSIVTSGWDTSVRVWDIENWATRVSLRGHSDKVLRAEFSSDGSRVLTTSDDGSIRIWDAYTGIDLAKFGGSDARVLKARFSEDDERLFTISNDGTVKIWDGKLGRTLTTLQVPGQSHDVTAVGISANGSHLITVDSTGKNNEARLWNMKKGITPTVLTGFSDTFAIEFSADGTHFVDLGFHGSIRLWDTTTNSMTAVLSGHADMVHCARFSPDGLSLVSGGIDKVVRLWDVAHGTLRGIFEGHTARVLDCEFSRDGSRIVTTSSDGTVRIWNVISGAQLLILKGHDGEVNSAQFSHNGSIIVTAGSDQTARLWDANDGIPLATFTAHYGAVIRAEFSPDDSHILTASADGLARIFSIRPEQYFANACKQLSRHPEQYQKISTFCNMKN